MKYFLALVGMALVSGFSLVQLIPTTASDFRLDELGNVYHIYPNHIERSNSDGQLLFRTSDLNYGPIQYLDVTNALKPFIYYKDQGKIVMLDNTLSQQGEAVDLFQLGMGQIELVAGSRGDAYWLWDVLNSELIRADMNFTRTNASGNVAVLTGKSLYPIQLLEKGNTVYLLDAKEGLLLFDIYANYKTTLPIHPEGNVQVVDGSIVYKEKGMLHIIAPDLINERTLPLPDGIHGNVSLFKGKLYAAMQGGIGVFIEK